MSNVEPSASQVGRYLDELSKLPDGDPRVKPLIDEILKIELDKVHERVMSDPEGFLADVARVGDSPSNLADPHTLHLEQTRIRAGELFQRAGDLLDDGKPSEAIYVLMEAIGLLTEVNLPIPQGFLILLGKANVNRGGSGRN